MRNNMKKTFFGALIVTAALLTGLVSCAETEDTDLTAFRQEAFDVWMKKYHPQAERQESGMYVEWIERNPEGRPLYEGYWMKLDYTGMLKNEEVFVSRSRQIAKQVGFFAYTTNYVPEFMEYYPASTGTITGGGFWSLAPGQILALQTMNEGDSLRIYLPPSLSYAGYGFYGSDGYSPANMTVEPGTPLIFDMKLNEVIPDPVLYGAKQVEAYAQNELGIADLADTVKVGMYLKILEPKPQGDSIGRDSSLSVYYIGRLLDGFIFDTNIDTIAVQNNIYSTDKSYMPLTFKPGDDDEGAPIEGFRAATLEMRRGEWARTVFVSGLGYGAAGNSPSIPAYAPLVFDIYVEPVDRGDDEEE